MIDFELAQKINHSISYLSIDYRCELAGIYEEARTTYVDDVDDEGWSDYAGSDGDSTSEDHSGEDRSSD